MNAICAKCILESLEVRIFTTANANLVELPKERCEDRQCGNHKGRESDKKQLATRDCR